MTASKTTTTLLLIALALTAPVAHAQSIPAFSGATGPGGNATGGRGGDVYHVNTLDPDKNGALPGSLQYGINNAPLSGRTIVFDVGGTIFLDGLTANDRLRYGKANITIAGQTAPGPGITIAGTGTKWTGENFILRNITIRPNRNANGVTHDAFDLQVKNSILDHVTASWFTDEGISQTDSGVNSTIQYASIAEGLNYAGHSYGSIIATEVDGTQVSFNHNLYAHNNSRMPRLGSETGSTGAVLDWSNNVIYNWQSRAGYSGTNQPSRSNFVGNYYIKGPNNGATAFLGGDTSSAGGFTQVYQSTAPTLANKFDDDKDGQLHDGIVIGPSTTLPNSGGQKAYAGNTTFVGTPFTVAGAGPYETADVALDRVLAYGGANWANRHPIDQRIFNSVATGTGGLITDLTSGPQVAEWQTVLAERTAVSRPADFDIDNDGMPGYWEVEHGLDPTVANYNGDFDSDGYTDLEEYINELGEWPASQPITFSGATNGRYAQITNWDLLWQPSKYDTAVINSGTVTIDAVGQHAGSLILGANPEHSPTLNITAGWIKVEDAPHGMSDGLTLIGDSASVNATLNLSGGMLRTEVLDKNSGSSFKFTGGVLSADTVGFDLVNNGGTIAPGQPVGVTDVFGDLELNSGTLAIELASPTEADLVRVTGAFTLGGNLDVSLLDGFAPTNGSWVVATASSFSGAFASVTPGFAVSQQGANLVLSVVAPLPGDYNFDGSVDAADYTVWRDGNSPDSGQAGYDLWVSSYGANAAALHASAATDSVPEPASVALILLATLAATLRRRVG